MQKRMLVTAVALAALLSACSSPAPPPVHTAALTATPVFASDAEALAAAEAALRSYLSALDEVSSGGGADTAALEPLVSKSQYREEEESAESYRTHSLFAKGSTRFRNLSIQDNSLGLDGFLTSYVCLDSSNVRIFDDANTDVTPESRPDSQTLQVNFVASEKSKALLIDEVTPWSGSSVC